MQSPPRKESGLPARLAIGWHSIAFLAAFALLAALGWQGKRTQETLLQTNRAVSHSLEVITSVQAILSSLQDIETGSRGFILTGDASYLEPYERGLNQLEGYRRSLEQLVEGRSYPDQRWFRTLDATIAERLQVAAGNVQARRDAGLQAAAERRRGRRDKHHMWVGATFGDRGGSAAGRGHG